MYRELDVTGVRRIKEHDDWACAVDGRGVQCHRVYCLLQSRKKKILYAKTKTVKGIRR